MKLSFLLLSLLCCLCAGAQQLLYVGMHGGSYTPAGPSHQYLRGNGQMGLSAALPLQFTRNRLWWSLEANGNIGGDVHTELPLETTPGRITRYDTEFYTQNFNFRTQLQYHLLPKKAVSPFAAAGLGYGLLNNSIWVRDPEDSFELCLPLLAEQDFRSRPFFAAFSAGLLFNARNLLQRPGGRAKGTGGASFSINYLHGPDITVLPFRDHRAGRLPDPKGGTPVVAPFQNPANPADVHVHQLTNRYQVPLRAIEIRLSLLFCPFSSYDD